MKTFRVTYLRFARLINIISFFLDRFCNANYNIFIIAKDVIYMEEWKYRQIFNSALYIDNNNSEIIISAEQLNKLMKKDNLIYKKKLKGHLFCPQCKKVQLAIAPIDKTGNYYLRVYPNQVHSPNCIKSNNYVSKRSFDEFVDNKKAIGFLNTRLTRIIDTLDRKVIDPRAVSLITTQNWKCIAQDELEDKPDEEKRIRQLRIKHLTSPVVEEYGYNLIFYGTVDIIFTTFKRKNCIRIFKKNAEYNFCLLTMNSKISNKIMNMYRLEKNKRYNNIHLAFIANMEKGKDTELCGEIIDENYLVLKAK